MTNRGQCTFCEKMVFLVYADPVKKIGLVTASHDESLTDINQAKNKPSLCLGSGQKPKVQKVARE